MTIGATNPNDGYHYVWDQYNDGYVRAIPSPATGGLEDYEDCPTAEIHGVSSHQLMQNYGLCLHAGDYRSQAEHLEIGRATLYHDTKGKVIGFYHSVGIVASIPEWANVDWEAQ